MKRIFILEKPDGSFTKNCEEAKEEAIRYFTSMLGSLSSHTYLGKDALMAFVHKRIPVNLMVELDRLPTDIKIQNAFFSMHSNKAPGLDGYNAHFFKDSWAMTGPSIIAAIKEFFQYGELLKESNTTLLALIPKVPNPSKMGDFRPISYSILFINASLKLLLVGSK